MGVKCMKKLLKKIVRKKSLIKLIQSRISEIEFGFKIFEKIIPDMNMGSSYSKIYL